MELYSLLPDATQPATPQRLNVMQQRVQALFRKAGDALHHDSVLTAAFEELVSALEVMHAGERERRAQLEMWLNERSALQAEIDRYRQLFLLAPIAYFVTSVDGTIRTINHAAAQLLGAHEKGLVGRSLSLFLPGGQRRAFRTDVAQVAQSGQTHEWTLTMQSLDETPFSAEVTVTPNHSADGRTLALWWLVRPLEKERTV